MHINMKYYIASIGAIFISLGIGILVGYNLNYDQELSKQQASVISDLDNKFDALKVTNDNLEKSDRLDFIINDNLNECLHIGDKAPLFNAKTTFGNIKLSDYAGKLLILFSHPR